MVRKSDRRKPRPSSGPPDSHAYKWYEVGHLIAGLDAPPNVRHLLHVAQLHWNAKKRCAWASQETLAEEMGVSLATAKRAFRKAKNLGVLGVRRIRTGKGHADQFNEYWTVPERMAQLQRPPRPPKKEPSSTTETGTDHPSPVMADATRTETKQGSPVTHAQDTTKGQMAPIPRVTGELQGLQVLHSAASDVAAGVDIGPIEHDTQNKHDTARQKNCRAAASKNRPSNTNPKPHEQERHFKPKELLTRFARLRNYSIIEADGRLGWIATRYSRRKNGDRVLNDWAYIVKANANLDAQHGSAPGGVGPFIERFSYREMMGIRKVRCPHCLAYVTAAWNCDCEAPL